MSDIRVRQSHETGIGLKADRFVVELISNPLHKLELWVHRDRADEVTCIELIGRDGHMTYLRPGDGALLAALVPHVPTT